MKSTLLLAALLLTQSVDSRWLPWVGCWTLLEDELRDPLAGALGAPSDKTAPRGGLVCLVPEGNGVRVSTFAGEEAFLEEVLVADGAQHPARQGGCLGWRRLDWSQDGRRLFTRSELTCEEERKRIVSGLSMMVGFSTWVEIQTVGSGDSRAVAVRRYRPADEDEALKRSLLSEEMLQEARQARIGMSGRLSIDDVIEAARKAESEAVEAALVENGKGFPLDSKALLKLGDTSVSPRIIDLMVALSYPDRFVIHRRIAGSGGGGGFGYPSLYDPFFYAEFAYPYYFAPFGYYNAPWDWIYVGRPSFTPEASVGRVVQGRGYTRVLPRDEEERRFAKRRGESDGGSWWSDGDGSSRGGSSSGSVSPDGYTRGGSSEREAKPKQN